MTRLAWFLSFCTGFISLSEEIIWVRIVSFSFESTPRAFALVLTAFLGGIALGALLGKHLSEKQKATPLTAAWLMLLAGMLLMLLPSIVIELNNTSFPVFWMLLTILMSSAIKGTLFPIVHHLGSSHIDADKKTLGRSVSKTYFFNILGSTLGPLFTGLFLLDILPSGSSLQSLGLTCLAIAIITTLLAARHTERKQTITILFICTLSASAYPALNDSGKHLTYKLAINYGGEIRTLIENRHGIIHSIAGNDFDDTVLGGNVYDGRTNIDLTKNSNGIDRALFLYGLHPAPERVLVIGMSSGAWTRLIASIPSIKKIDVVEINPGYVQMIRNYPTLSPLLDDPRLELHIDDGRRWLRRSHQKFDLIVMNTTFHWRANITNLLSREMMELARNSLAPRGIFTFNTTYSYDSFFTASQVFPSAYLYQNFAYAAEYDFRDQIPLIPERLRKLTLDGHPLFSDDAKTNQSLEKLALIKPVEIQTITNVFPRPLVMVTDQNMITEFRFGRGAKETTD